MRKVKLNAASSSKMGGGREGDEEEGKRELWRKEKWLWLSKGLSTSLKVSFRVFEGTKGGRGAPLLAVSLLPSLKMNPIEWERWSDAETARNKALTGLKQTPFCMTTNTSLGELTAGNLRRDQKMPSLASNPTSCVNVSITCRTLRAAFPTLAGIRRHGEFDPQRLAAARRMVDGGVHHLIYGV